MNEPHDLPGDARREDAVHRDADVEAYVRAVEEMDAGDVTGAAVALADLLEARLEGADAPEARQVLDDLVSAARDNSGNPAE